MDNVDFRRERLPDFRGDRRGLLGSEPTARQSSILMRYWRIAVRQRIWILGSIAIALILGVIITLLMTPMYRATTRIEIQRESKNIVRIQGVEPESNAGDVEFYQTQYGLLRGRSLAEAVARKLRLGDSSGFFETFGQSDYVAEQFANGKPIKNDKKSRDDHNLLASKILLGHLKVEPQRLSRLVDLQFTSPDPDLSARVADAWASSFVETTLERRFDATSYAREFLERRLAQIRARLEASERMLVAYASQQRIVNLPSNVASATGSGADRPLLVDNLAQLNGELATAVADRVKAESRLETAGKSTTEALQNSTINTLRTSLAQAESEYARLLTQFDPQFPQAVASAAQIERLRRALSQEEARVGGSTVTTYQEAVRREQDLRKRVNQMQTGLLDLRRRSIQYNIYQRDVDTNRGLYDSLLQRYKEVGVAGGVGVNNISVIDPAEVPSAPSSPILLLNLAIALVLGTMIGGGIALALEQLDETISDPNDIPILLQLPLLGTVPKLLRVNPVEAVRDRKSALVESYLSIQTNLEFATDHGAPYVLAITSSRPAEGKSTTAFTLATLFARAGRKVVLIDGDMRSPSMNAMLSLSNDAGLSNYLAGNADAERLLQSTDTVGLSVMTAGPQPPNAAELLAGPRFGKLLAELRETFDHVIIDAPPVMGLADAPIITGQAESVIFTVEASGTRIALMKSALLRLEAAHAPVIGAVLTKFAEANSHYGYGYGYDYGTKDSEEA